MSIQDRINTLKTELTASAPFYASYIKPENVELTTDFKTLATDGQKVFINEDYVNGLTDNQFRAAVLHIITHQIFDIVNRRGDRNPRVWNMAACLVVNSTLIDGGLITVDDLPKNSHYLPTINAQTDTTETVYDRLEAQEIGEAVHIRVDELGLHISQ